MKLQVLIYTKCLALCMVLLTFFTQCGSNFVGSEVANEKVVVYMPGGKTPAANAYIQIIPVDYVPGKGAGKIYTDTTNSSGVYTTTGIPEGTYNVLAKKDTLISLLDSIYIKNSEGVPDDTLEIPGSLTAWVKLQPNHSPRTVIVQVIGTTEYYTNVDSSGKFTIKNMAEGLYQLRLETSQPLGYTPTIETIRIRTGMHDTLYEPIKLIYNGIAVVTGLDAVYNAQTKIITVQWDPVTYSDFNDYAVYRDNQDSLELSGTPIAYVDEPIFHDTIKSSTNETTSILRYMYRVAVRNKSLKEGETFRYVTVAVIIGNEEGLLFSSDIVAFKSNVPCTLRILPDPVLGQISGYYWAIGPGSEFKEVSKPETSIVIAIPGDSIVNDYICVAKVVTKDGIELSDTVKLQSQLVWNKVGDSPANSSSGYYSSSFKGQIFLFTSMLNANDTIWSCWSSSDGTAWNRISDSVPFKLQKKPLVFKDNLWIFERKAGLTNALIWHSEDGMSWDSQTVDSIPNLLYSSEYEVWSTWGERLVLVNYYPLCLADNSCDDYVNSWESHDGLNWNALNLNKSIFPDRYDKPNINFVACELNGKVYVGGAWRTIGLKNPLWEAYGFRIWNESEAEPLQINFPVPVDTNASFSNLNPEIVVFKGRLFMTSSVDPDYMWVLMADNRWVICTDTYPGGPNSQANDKYHTCCIHNENLISISNSGVWKVSKDVLESER